MKGNRKMKHECEHHQESACDCEKTPAEGCCCDEGCGCESGGYFQRQYQTREEQIARLEDYLKELKLEVQAVEEHLKDLHK
jgi:hypothetical protein